MSRLSQQLKTWRGDKVLFAQEALGIKLSPSQAEWLKSRAQFKTAVWGRRAGKTTVESIDALHVFTTVPESIQFNLSLTQDQAMILFNRVERLGMKLSEKIGVDIFDSQPKHSPFGEMTSIVGGKLHARTVQHEGKYIRGHGAHVVRLDEAGIIPDRTVDEAILPMLTDYDGQLVKIGTPWGRNHFHMSYREGLPDQITGLRIPGYFSLHCPTVGNPHVSHAFVERMRRRLSSIQFRTEFEAEFMDELGRVFPWPLIESCYAVKEPWSKDPLPDRTYVLGADIAKHLDWTVIYVLDATNPDDLKMVFKDRFQKEPWETVISRIRTAAETYHIATGTVDASGAGDPVMERLKDLPLEEYKGAAGPKLELINNLKVLMERGRVHFEWDRDLVRELRFYSYSLSTRSAHVIMGTQREHDDCVVALALAGLAAARMYAEPSIGVV